MHSILSKWAKDIPQNSKEIHLWTKESQFLEHVAYTITKSKEVVSWHFLMTRGKIDRCCWRCGGKAKDVAEFAKVKTEIASENKKVQQGYTELGKPYYEQVKDVEDGPAVELCNSIKEAQDTIALMEAKIAGKKEE